MDEKEFKKYIELIMSMSIDYIMGKLIREAYIANLKTIVKIVGIDSLKGELS